MAQKTRSPWPRRIAEIRRHLVGLTVSLLFLAPLAWSVLVSFKPSMEARQPPLPPWPVDGISVQNYENLAKFGAGIWTYSGNSLTVSAMTVLATVAIFAFLASWNEFLAALTLLTDQKKYTLPVLMAAVRSGQFGTIDWGAVQSGVTLMMAPCLVLFLLLQRYYIRGLTAGAVK